MSKSVLFSSTLSTTLHTCTPMFTQHMYPDQLATAHQHPPQSGGAVVEGLEGGPWDSCNASGAGSCSPLFPG